MDQSDQILRQLIWIKWLISLVALCFVLIAISISWGATQMAAGFKNSGGTSSISDDMLLEQGKEKELLQLSKERETNYPKDPYVFWNRARAYYQLGEYESALKTLRHLHELAPSWRQDHTEPYIKAIEEKLSKKR